MGVLYLLAVLLLPSGLRQVLFAVLGGDELCRHVLGLPGDTCGVGTQVGDQAYRALPLYVHALVELLGQAHGLLGGEVQGPAGLLLEGGCGKGQGRLLVPLSLLHLPDGVFRAFQGSHDPVGLLLAGYAFLFAYTSVVLRADGLLLPLHVQVHVQGPVFLRDEGVDLLLPVADDAQGHGLHPPGAQAPFDFLP